MVDVPVMANTVHSSAISPYHRRVHRGGISFGAIHLCRNVWLDDDGLAPPPPLLPLVEKHRALCSRDRDLPNNLEAVISFPMRGRQETLAAEVAEDDEVVLLAAAPADWWHNGCNRRLLLGEKHCRRRAADDRDAHLLNMVAAVYMHGGWARRRESMKKKRRRGDPPLFVPQQRPWLMMHTSLT